MFEELHWLPLHARIQYKILILIFKAQQGLALNYLVDVILRPHSASSNRSLRSLNRFDLIVKHSRSALAQSRFFASIGPFLWNALSPSVRSTFLTRSLSSSFAFLKTNLSHGTLHTGSTSERFTPLEVLYKCLNTIQYNRRRIGRSIDTSPAKFNDARKWQNSSHQSEAFE